LERAVILNTLLFFAAFLLVFVGIGHSYLGERYVLMRLFRHVELPRLAGSSLYMKQVLRFAWHVTSLAWWGLAAIVVMLTQSPLSGPAVGTAVGATSLATAVAILVGSRGKHLAWLLFLVVGAITIYAAAV
jgi:hypothetical protein